MISPAQLKLIACAVIIAMATFGGWSARGWKEGEKYQTMLADIERQHTAAMEKAISETKATKQMVVAIDKIRTQEKRDAQTKIDDLLGRIRGGTVRLSIPAVCTDQVPGSASNPGVGDGTARAELDRATASDLVAIAADGDAAIIQLNTCQDILEGLSAR